MSHYFIQIILGYILFTATLSAAELTIEQRQKAERVFQGVDDTIMRINSGVCRITGKTVEPDGNVIDDNIMLAFDYRSHFYRFENGNIKRALLTPDYYYEAWHLNTSSVSVKRSPASTPNVTSQFCRFVDIQNIFCFVPVGQQKPYSYQQSDLHLRPKELLIVHYEELPNDLTKIKTVTPPHLVKEYTEYVIDKKNGYTIQSIQRDVGYVFELSWQNINQTWVPGAYVFKSGPKFGNFGVEWKIDWEQVNEKVDQKIFELNEMLADQEEGALMLSEELESSPIIIGKVGKDEPEIAEGLPQNQSSLRKIFIALGILLIAIALGKKLYDWKTQPFK